MTIEDKCKVYKELIDWGNNTFSNSCEYLGERMYVIKTGYGVGIVRADSYDEAREKSKLANFSCKYLLPCGKCDKSNKNCEYES